MEELHFLRCCVIFSPAVADPGSGEKLRTFSAEAKLYYMYCIAAGSSSRHFFLASDATSISCQVDVFMAIFSSSKEFTARQNALQELESNNERK